MKKTIQLLALAIALTGCGKASKVTSYLEEQINNQDVDYGVIMIMEGENLEVPLQPVAKHNNQDKSIGGGRLHRHVYILNNIAFYGYNGCTGCDSCMQCYADKGLIEYKVKERLDDIAIADIHLTDKGKKYLAEDYCPFVHSETRDIKQLHAQNVSLVVFTREQFKDVEIINEATEGKYLKYTCKGTRYVEATPWAEALGEVRMTQEVDTLVYNVYTTESDAEWVVTDEDGYKLKR